MKKGTWNYETCIAEARKYECVSDFRKGAAGAYKAAWKNGWLKNYTFFKNPSLMWDYDACYAEAKKYDYSVDFKEKSGSAYNSARQNGWLSEYTWLSKKSKGKGFWTRENCLKEAKKYKSYHDFHSSVAYQKAMREGWLEDYSWFDDYPKETPTYEMCREDALKFQTLKDYREKGDYYYTALHKGYIASFDWLKRACKPNGYWNYDTCYEEAKKYKNRWAFEQGCPSAKHVAIENGWIDDYDWFEIKHVNKLHKFNLLKEFEDEFKFRTFLANNDVNILQLILVSLCEIEPKYAPIEKDIEMALANASTIDPIEALEQKYSTESETETEPTVVQPTATIDLDNDEEVYTALATATDEQSEPSIEDLIHNHEQELQIINRIEHMLTPEIRDKIMNKYLNDRRRAWMAAREKNK